MVSNISQIFTEKFDFFFNNKIISTVIAILLALYSAMIASKLPNGLNVLVDNFYIKLMWIFLIAYLASHNPLLSILLAISILLTFQTLIALESTNNLVKTINVNDNECAHDNDIPLSPMRTKIIQDAVNKIKDYQIQANNAIDNDMLNYYNNEINNQNIIIECSINAKKALLAAKDAESMNDINSATQYMNEVNKNNIKIIALLKSDELKIKAAEAKNNGDINKYNEFIVNALNEENKINIINKADQLIISANNALASNDSNTADSLIQEAIKLYESLNINGSQYPSGNDLSNIYSAVTDNTNIDIKPILDLPEDQKLTEYNVLAYSGPDYPNY